MSQSPWMILIQPEGVFVRFLGLARLVVTAVLALQAVTWMEKFLWSFALGFDLLIHGFTWLGWYGVRKHDTGRVVFPKMTGKRRTKLELSNGHILLPRAGIEDHFDKVQVIATWVATLGVGLSYGFKSAFLLIPFIAGLALIALGNFVLLNFHYRDRDPLAPNALSGHSRVF